jgi:hypothetical protein
MLDWIQFVLLVQCAKFDLSSVEDKFEYLCIYVMWCRVMSDQLAMLGVC